jgi:ribonuclease HII
MGYTARMGYKPNFSIEAGYEGVVAGIDEAGCGPLAGPVIAAAVILNRRKRPAGINDSKKLTPEKREQLYSVLIATAHTAVGTASVEEIDTLNILNARLLAMRRACEALELTPHIALVDGNRAPQLACPIRLVIGGDRESMSIAAASIIAKVTRDRIMRQLAQECPGYGWERNAGYGTAEHYRGLNALGVTPHHRRSFSPVRLIVEAAA